jgi:crotonobetainyl-CoA:carnitine CoA-transferase CaiB-like acyl-CoA transferase
VEVGVRAYGWSGPWHLRRGFDTITQFSTGIAAANKDVGAREAGDPPSTRRARAVVDASRPREAPVEMLDLGTGYLMAAAAIRGLTRRHCALEESGQDTAPHWVACLPELG